MSIFTPTVIVLLYMLNVKSFQERIVWLDIGTVPHEVEYTTLWRSKITDLLDKDGYKVYWTQDMPDVDTTYRLRRLQNSRGVLIMLGINHATATAGCHVFTKPIQSLAKVQDTLSTLLAEHIMVALDTVMEVKSGTKGKKQDVRFLEAVDNTSVLLEVGTLSKNPEIKTEKFSDKFSHAVLIGVNNYFESLKVIERLQESKKKRSETNILD